MGLVVFHRFDDLDGEWILRHNAGSISKLDSRSLYAVCYRYVVSEIGYDIIKENIDRILEGSSQEDEELLDYLPDALRDVEPPSWWGDGAVSASNMYE